MDEQLRRTAATRPGYATYPNTRPGDPSWWRRGQEIVSTAMIPPPLSSPPPPPPPPVVDGETCKRWCGFCHVGTGEPAPSNAPITEDFGPVPVPPSPKPPPDKTWLRAEPAPPRRRWWHRLTRKHP